MISGVQVNHRSHGFKITAACFGRDRLDTFMKQLARKLQNFTNSHASAAGKKKKKTLFMGGIYI